MSSLTGSVDLVREQERQARQQLLDEFRDPSPQPIFSQPVKVELEDETSRRIKDTLGDFNQLQHVLIHDPKHLIGISRSDAVAAAANNAAATAASRSISVDHGGGGSTTWSARNHVTSNGLSRSTGNLSNGHHGTSKRYHQTVNGLNKHLPHPGANTKSGTSVDKRQSQHGPPKHRSDHPPKINPISKGYSSSVGHLDQPPPSLSIADSGTKPSNPDRSSRPPSHHSSAGISVCSEKTHENTSHHYRRTSSNVSVAPGNSDSKIIVENGPISSIPNGVVKHHRPHRIPEAATKKYQGGSTGGKHPPLPPKLSIPSQEERKSELEVETILKEMKQAVPPPLTGIQTPRTEETGFHFPLSEINDKGFSRVLQQFGHHALPSMLPSPPPPPPPPPERHSSSKKSPHRTNSPFNLQEDLEMSESDDEVNMVPACKNSQIPEIDSYTKCLPPSTNRDESNGLGSDRTDGHVQNDISTHGKKANLGLSGLSKGSPNNVGRPALSSSSDSSESESEDSCSSDSSASSEAEASDREMPAKHVPPKWSLSNFFDETRKNHSPAMAMDTNTNSDISTAPRDEQQPGSVPPAEKDGRTRSDAIFNTLLDKFSESYSRSPGDESHNAFHVMGTDSARQRGNENRIPPSPPPVLPPPIHRGPRTPPSPPTKQDSEDDSDSEPCRIKDRRTVESKYTPETYSRRNAKTESRGDIKNELNSTSRMPDHHRSRSEQFYSSRSKKKVNSRIKESVSPVVAKSEFSHDSDIETNSSACKEHFKASFKEDSRNSSGHHTTTTSSCPVPSVTTSTPKSTHRSPVKSHHKHSSPAASISSSHSSPNKKRITNDSKENIKNERTSSRAKNSEKSKTIPDIQTSHSRSSSSNKCEREPVSVSSSVSKSSKHDKVHSSKSKHHSSSKVKSNSENKVSETSISPNTSLSKKSKSKSSKSLTSKSSSSHENDKKKREKKKKSSKFSIENFLQSPRSSPLHTYKGNKITDPISPMKVSDPEDLPLSPLHRELSDSSPKPPEIDESIKNSHNKDQNFPSKRKVRKHRKLSVSSTSRSRSRSNSGTRFSSSEKVKRPRNLKRRMSRSSNSDLNSSNKSRHRDAKQTIKPPSSSSSVSPPSSRHHSPDCLPPRNELQPPNMLSPISSFDRVDSAIDSSHPPSPFPKVLMVSIELSKLLRIPNAHHRNSPPRLKPPKLEQSNDSYQQKSSTIPLITESSDIPLNSSVSCERRSTSSLSPYKKDVKTKHRTESSKSSKHESDYKSIEKSSKTQSSSDTAIIDRSSGISTSAATSSDKISIKNSETSSKHKTGHDSSSVSSKKRKPEENGSDSKKKPKITSVKSSPVADVDFKEKTLVVKVEKLDTIALDKKMTPKVLERCDSASSLSSLCSQISHKSSKSLKERPKDVIKDIQDTKKVKSSAPVSKEIKREKEEKPKAIVKKEPSSSSKTEKVKSKSKERSSVKVSSTAVSEGKKAPDTCWDEGHSASSQVCYRENTCKIEETKPQPTNHQRNSLSEQDTGSDWEHFAPEVQQELKNIPNHINKVSAPVPSEYYWQEGKKLKALAVKEKNPILQALKYFEASVMFILTSLHRELTNKDSDSIFQMYRDTLRFTGVIRTSVQKRLSHSTPGNIDFKILILCLKCQSLLHLKLYNLKIKEVKEQHKGVSDFMHSSSSKLGAHCSPLSSSNSHSRNMSQPSPCQPRLGGGGGASSVPSPHSPTPSPAGSVASVGSQSSGYSSSEVNGNHSRPHSSASMLQLPQHVSQLGTVTVPQNMFELMAKHHSHLSNLHLCHELWEQADMYMTRSNSKDFFKEIAEKSEKLSLHSNIKELVSYLQTGLALLKSSYC